MKKSLSRSSRFSLLCAVLLGLGCDQWQRSVGWVNVGTQLPASGSFTLRCGYGSATSPIAERPAPLTFGLRVLSSVHEEAVSFTMTVDQHQATLAAGSFNPEGSLVIYCAQQPQDLGGGRFTQNPTSDGFFALVVFARGSTSYQVHLTHLYYGANGFAFAETRPLPSG